MSETHPNTTAVDCAYDPGGKTWAEKPHVSKRETWANHTRLPSLPRWYARAGA
jgi:hypothetical protein